MTSVAVESPAARPALLAVQSPVAASRQAASSAPRQLASAASFRVAPSVAARQVAPARESRQVVPPEVCPPVVLHPQPPAPAFQVAAPELPAATVQSAAAPARFQVPATTPEAP